MPRLVLCLLAVILSLGISSRASAQPRYPQAGQPTSRAAAAPAAGVNRFLHIPGRMMFPLSMEGVQRDIELSPEQKQELKRISAGYLATMQQLDKTFNSLEPEEKQKQGQEIAEQAAQAAKNAQRKAEAVLSPQQLHAVTRIAVELLGTSALADPKTQEKIGLTPEQRQRLQRLFEQSGEKMQQLQRETAQQAMQVLQAEQAADLRKQLEAQPKPQQQQ